MPPIAIYSKTKSSRVQSDCSLVSERNLKKMACLPVRAVGLVISAFTSVEVFKTVQVADRQELLMIRIAKVIYNGVI